MGSIENGEYEEHALERANKALYLAVSDIIEGCLRSNDPLLKLKTLYGVMVEAINLRLNKVIIGGKGGAYCPRGHLYTSKNTYITRNSRRCKTCHSHRNNKYYIKQRARVLNDSSMGN